MPTKEEMRSLGEEIVRSYEDRISGVARVKEAEAERKRTGAKEIAQRRSDVGAMLKGFDDAHAAMSNELKADLAKVAPALRESEAKRKRTEAKEIAQRRSDVGTMLKGFDDAHAAMSNELKADLAKVAPALRESEAKRKRTEAKEIAQRKLDVSTMLKEFDEEQAGARDEWYKLTATMQAKRGGVAVEAKPPETVAALRAQVFEYLANHPDGTKLVELAEEFGVARIQMAKVVRNLMDENKIEKRALLYFAV
jgi:alpha-D-ribose 1-methylphosphonate 5-triphosphate synthase subunit PhnG